MKNKLYLCPRKNEMLVKKGFKYCVLSLLFVFLSTQTTKADTLYSTTCNEQVSFSQFANVCNSISCEFSQCLSDYISYATIVGDDNHQLNSKKQLVSIRLFSQNPNNLLQLNFSGNNYDTEIQLSPNDYYIFALRKIVV